MKSCLRLAMSWNKPLISIFNLASAVILLCSVATPASSSEGSGYSAQVLSLHQVSGAAPGATVKLWAQVKNTGSSSLPANAAVWFWVSGPAWFGNNWIGSASIAQLAPKADNWYAFNWTIPTNTVSGSYAYWAQTWASAAISDWSNGQLFDVSGSGAPGGATLISPSGAISTTTPSYTWNAVATAMYYMLYVNDNTTSTGKIRTWYTAEQAGCASGTGTCSITPTTSLAAGSGQWWIQTWNNSGYGPWSDVMSFQIMPTGIELFATGLWGPFGISFDSAGNLFVANEGIGGGGDRVSKITPAGSISTFATGFNGVSGLAFDSRGGLFVSDDTNRIFKLNADGSASVYIDRTAGLSNPNAIIFDSKDHLYVVSAGGFVSRFDSTGAIEQVSVISGLDTPEAIVMDEPNSRFFVSESNGKIWAVDISLGTKSLYATTGARTEGGLVQDAQGNLYLSAFTNGDVLKIARSDQSLTVCVNGLINPRGLTFDSTGRLYITQYSQGEIVRVQGCMAQNQPVVRENAK